MASLKRPHDFQWKRLALSTPHRIAPTPHDAPWARAAVRKLPSTQRVETATPISNESQWKLPKRFRAPPADNATTFVDLDIDGARRIVGAGGGAEAPGARRGSLRARRA